MHKLVFLTLVLATLPTGCTSRDAKATPAHQASTTEDRALCVQVFTRARACTDDYIPALVDVRAKYDKPAGIAAEVKQDRAAVIAQARQEWADDSKDAAIAATCDRMISDITDEDRALGAKCLAIADCAGFTSCVMPGFEKHIDK